LKTSPDIIISTLIEKLLLNQGNTLSGVEMKPSTWHTIFPLTEEAVIVEIKEGPYIPTEESDFASWAPAEGDASVMEFLSWLDKAKVGEKYCAEVFKTHNYNVR
jgi:hypothetical protein